MASKKNHLTDYWISYSDLMAGLLFVLLAIIVISNFQYKKKLEIIGENIELREKIAKELKTNFTKHNVTAVKVDPETGDIEFLDTEDLVWFDFDKAQLLPKAKEVLDEVIPIYLGVLFNKQITEDHLDRILIEGHASEEANLPVRYLHDLDLSQRRAFAVGMYIMQENSYCYEKLKTHMVALGRSFADAKYKGVNNPNSKKDRKVVIKYTLHYEKMMRDLINVGKET
ncbi:MAG: OmpA family protein [candidate division Zixibacteria bacterium]|nr:OmpA family protein [candidate division Zixibacteria bacterium]